MTDSIAKPPRSTLELISKIKAHPKFKDLSILDKQEFDGAVFIWNDPSSGSHIKSEERRFFVGIWERLHS